MENQTNNLTEVSDEIINDSNRYYELLKKSNLNDEEKKELDDLKQNYGQKVQKKVGKLIYETKVEREAREKAEREREELRAENVKLRAEQEQSRKPEAKTETVKIGSKVFYTDATLKSMVEAGEISDGDAWEHSKQRNKAELKDEVMTEIRHGKEEEEIGQVMASDARSVIEKYPHFDKNNKGHDPEDPLYVEATRIYQQFVDPRTGRPTNPRALSMAVELAERIVGKPKTKPDVSEHLNVGTSSASVQRRTNGKQETEFNDDEKETAIRLYRNQVNPKTGRNYTPDEAILKAKKAKTERAAERAERLASR